jgi:hypothetical protein
MTAAFDELLADVTALLESTRAQKPLDRDELRFWSRQLNALNKAQYHWASGVRPIRCGACWLVPSASLGGALVYRLCQLGGIWICNCTAGEKGILCWHHMAINVIERAAELESLAEDEAEARLSLKISETRAKYMAAA